MTKCEFCDGRHHEQTSEAKPRSAMTAYHWDGTGDNPNADVVLCDECWEDYRSYWQERWDEYYSMVL